MNLSAIFSIISLILIPFVGILATAAIIVGLIRGFRKSAFSFIISFGALAVSMWVSGLFLPVAGKIVTPMFESSARIKGYGDLIEKLISDGGEISELTVYIFGAIATAGFVLLFYWFAIILINAVVRSIKFVRYKRIRQFDGRKEEKKKKKIWSRMGGGLLMLMKALVFIYVLVMPMYGLCAVAKEALTDPSADACLENFGIEQSGEEIYENTAGRLAENIIVKSVGNAGGDVHFTYITSFELKNERISLAEGCIRLQEYVSGLPDVLFVKDADT